MNIRMIGLAAVSTLALAACSDSLTEEEEIAQIEAHRAAVAAEQEAAAPSVQSQYDRAVECAATAANVSNVFNVIATMDEDSNPTQAAQTRAQAQENMAQARVFAQQAEQIASDPEIGKSRDAVMADIDSMDRAIRQRGRDAADFTTFARQLARDSDQCDPAQNASG